MQLRITQVAGLVDLLVIIDNTPITTALPVPQIPKIQAAVSQKAHDHFFLGNGKLLHFQKTFSFGHNWFAVPGALLSN